MHEETDATEAHVEIDGVSKRFGGIAALSDVTLTIRRGQVHALVGENGAGKSTLGRIIAGSLRPDEGTIRVKGEEVAYGSPREALADGIARMDQELCQVPQLTVAQNVLLGAEARRFGVLNKADARRRFDELNRDSGFELDGDALSRTQSIAEQQKAEMLRAVAHEAELIVMDEPTAPLTPDEAERMYGLVRRLRDRGMTIVYVSHFLDEVLDLADTVTVLRDGKLIRTSPASEETTATLVNAMIGRDLESLFPERRAPAPDAPIVFSASNVSRGARVRDVSLSVRAGEIVGLFGLVGSGRTELARALFGADKRTDGTIELDGRQIDVRLPRHAIREGIAMLPEDRKGQGLCIRRSISENVMLAHTRSTILNKSQERERVGELLRRLDVRAPNGEVPVGTLSGGNQQKVLFAKWLNEHPRFLIVDEPTRGVDVGAKRGIHQLLADLAAEGVGMLVISSELEEVLGIAHRVLVMRDGAIVAEFSADEATEDAVLTEAFGPQEAAA